MSPYGAAGDEPHTATFPEPVALPAQGGGAAGLKLSVTHVFAIVAAEPERSRERWRVTTRMYEYSLLDRDETELLVYHWQPDADRTYPHLHVSAALSVRRRALEDKQAIDLDGLHLPTGRVSLEAIVRMLIDEFEIAARYPEADWRRRLEETEAVFRDAATQRI